MLRHLRTLSHEVVGENRMMVKRFWKLTVGVFCFSVIGIIYLGYFYHGRSSALRGIPVTAFKSNYEAYFAGRFLQNKFTENELNKEYDLDLGNEDVIVFLHIQKTGGTSFGKHLVENLDVDSPCNCYKRVRKHCDCLTKEKQVWLFSRYSTGWQCGLHADWTELKPCVDQWFQTNYGKKKRRYHYITLLRDPVSRFVSEWLHVQRGATWKTAALKCNGRQATLEEVPFCYSSVDWRDVTLEEFLACQHNLAFNRQTRMLANLSKVNCYNTSAISTARRHRLMLESAKENLVNLAFFGLVEFQTYTQFLFEHTLNINFVEDFVQQNGTLSSRHDLSSEELERVAHKNQLDIELYQFAKDLFLQRVRQAFVEENITVPEDLAHFSAAHSASGGDIYRQTLSEDKVPTSQLDGLGEETRKTAIRSLVGSPDDLLSIQHFSEEDLESSSWAGVAVKPESPDRRSEDYLTQRKRRRKNSNENLDAHQDLETDIHEKRIPVGVNAKRVKSAK